MFRREHHQRIADALGLMKIENLVRCGCLFGGGTALVLQLGEYRESVDIDFLCVLEANRELAEKKIKRPLGKKCWWREAR